MSTVHIDVLLNQQPRDSVTQGLPVTDKGEEKGRRKCYLLPYKYLIWNVLS